MDNILVIGGGLSGLTTAYLLKKQGFSVTVLEANNYFGGRIKTIKTSSGACLELGATWVFYDSNLRTLLNELGLKLYEQYNIGNAIYELSNKQPPEVFNVLELTGGQKYYKIVGGASSIINKLSEAVGIQNLNQNTIVSSIEDKGEYIELITSTGQSYEADYVISTIPPNLLQASITFKPEFLDSSNSYRKQTHTWMGESIKFSVEYRAPFWREANLAGFAVSMAGIVREVQDHVNAEGNAFALVGFLNLKEEHYNLTKDERRKIVIRDLVRLFGEKSTQVINYEELIWSRQAYTSVNANTNKGLFAHQNNGHKEIVKPQMNQKLFFAGTETSNVSPGYMEGAVISAHTAVRRVVNQLAKKNN